MERTAPPGLALDALQALVLRLQERLEVGKVGIRDQEQTQRLALQSQLIERQAKRIAELEKENPHLPQSNPTQRLEEAYSLRPVVSRSNSMATCSIVPGAVV